MNIKLLTNTLVLWSHYHGIIGVRDWDNLKNICCKNITNIDNCGFADNFDSTYMNNSAKECGNKVLQLLNITSSSSISSL